MHRTLGIDLGTTNSVMAYVRKGEPTIILNRSTSDLTPSVVQRGRRGDLVVGQVAKQQAARDPANTISSIKRYMGRKFADPAVQKVLSHVPYRVTEGPDGDVRVWFNGREYTP